MSVYFQRKNNIPLVGEGDVGAAVGLGVVEVVVVVVVIASGQQTPIYLMSTKMCRLKTIAMLTNLPSMIHM